MFPSPSGALEPLSLERKNFSEIEREKIFLHLRPQDGNINWVAISFLLVGNFNWESIHLIRKGGVLICCTLVISFSSRFLIEKYSINRKENVPDISKIITEV